MDIASIAIQFIGIAVSGIAGNRADSAVISAVREIAKRLKQGGKPVNHDLERAVRRAYLQATVIACSALEQSEKERAGWKSLFGTSAAAVWSNKVKRGCRAELKRMQKDSYMPREFSFQVDAGLFLQPRGDQALMQLDQLQEKLALELLQEMAARYGEVPEVFADHITTGWPGKPEDQPQQWFDYVCAFFADEIKNNTRLRSIFDSKILAELKIADIPLSIGLLQESLERQGKKAREDLVEIRHLLEGQELFLHRLDQRAQDMQAALLALGEGESRLERLEKESRRFQISQQYTGKEVADRVANRVRRLTASELAGREVAWQALDNLLTGSESQAVLVTSPAGFGKSTLLAHWLEARSGEGIFIAHHFFAPEISSIGDAYLNLLRQLLVYYELTDQIIPDHPDRIRDMIYGLISERGSRPGEPLVILIDALDEADVAFRPPFPSRLPEGVFLIASIRSAGAEVPVNASSWAQGAQHVHLNHLDAAAIGAWIHNSGLLEHWEEPLSQEDLVQLQQQIYEKTLGFPLYLHYLLDDLKQTSLSYDALKPVLGDMPVGFEAYVRDQFRALAQHEAVRQKEWRDLFALLVSALGPLDETDIAQLTPLSAWDLHALPWELERWFNIQQQEERRLFSFAHPLLAQVFRKIVGPQATEAARHLLAYCRRWNEHQSRYALQYLPQHLLESGEKEELCNLLTGSREWLELKRRLLRQEGPYLADLELAINSYSAPLGPESLLALVKLQMARLVTLAHTTSYDNDDLQLLSYLNRTDEALDLARTQTDAVDRMKSLAAIYQTLSALGRPRDAIQEELITEARKQFSDPSQFSFWFGIVSFLDKPETTHIKTVVADMIADGFIQLPTELYWSSEGMHFLAQHTSRINEPSFRSALLGLIRRGDMLAGKAAGTMLKLTGDEYIPHFLEIFRRPETRLEILVDFSVALAEQGYLMQAIDLYRHLPTRFVRDIPPAKRVAYLFRPAGALASQGRFDEIEELVEDWSIGFNLVVREYLVEQLAKVNRMTLFLRVLETAQEKLERLYLSLLFYSASKEQDNSEAIFSILGDLTKIIEELDPENNNDKEVFWWEKINNQLITNWYDRFPSEVADFFMFQTSKISEPAHIGRVTVLLIGKQRFAEAQSIIERANIFEYGDGRELQKIALAYAQVGEIDQAEIIYRQIQKKKSQNRDESREKVPFLSLWAYALKRMGYDRSAGLLLKEAESYLSGADLTKFWAIDNQALYALALVQNDRVSDALELNKAIRHPVLQQKIIHYFIEHGAFDQALTLIPDLLAEGKGPDGNVEYKNSIQFLEITAEFLVQSSLKLPGEKVKEYLEVLQPIANKILHSYFDLTQTQHFQVYGLIDYVLALDILGENPHELFSKLILRSLLDPKGIESLRARTLAVATRFQYYSFVYKFITEIDATESDYVAILKQLPKDAFAPEAQTLRHYCQQQISNNKHTEGEEYLTAYLTQLLSKRETSADFFATLCYLLPQLSNNIYSGPYLFKVLHSAARLWGWQDSKWAPFVESLEECFEKEKNTILNCNQEESKLAPTSRQVTTRLKGMLAFLLAEKNFLAGRVAPSLESYNQAIEADPEIGTYYYRRGVAQLAFNCSTDAVQDLEIAMLHSHLQEETRPMLMRALLETNNLTKASSLTGKYGKENSLVALLWRAMIALADKRIEDCFYELDLVEKDCSPDWFDTLAEVYFLRGSAWLVVENISEAYSNFSLCINNLHQESEPLVRRLNTVCIQLAGFHVPDYHDEELNELAVMAAAGRKEILKLRIFLFWRMQAAVMARILPKGNPYQELADFLGKGLLQPEPELRVSAEKTNNARFPAIDIWQILGLSGYWYGGLLSEKTVILLQGNNLSNRPIFSYLIISLFHFGRLRDIMVAGESFTPSDHGEILVSGYGPPSESVRLELARKFKMVDLPSPG